MATKQIPDKDDSVEVGTAIETARTYIHYAHGKTAPLWLLRMFRHARHRAGPGRLPAVIVPGAKEHGPLVVMRLQDFFRWNRERYRTMQEEE